MRQAAAVKSSHDPDAATTSTTHPRLSNTAAMTGKRSHLGDEGDSDSKRVRSNNGSPAPPAQQNGVSDAERKKQEAQARMAAIKARLAANKPNGNASAASPIPAPSVQDEIASKKAEAEAKMSHVKPRLAAARGQTNGATATPPPAAPSPVPVGGVDIEAKRAEAQRKIAAMKAKMAAQRGQAAASPTAGSPSPGPAQQKSDVQQRMEETRRRVEELARQRSSTPSMPAPPPRQDAPKTRGGLGIGLHPSLMGDLGASKGKAPAGKEKGSQREPQAKVNPYLSSEPATDDKENEAFTDPSLSKKAAERKSKQLVFNQKGKFIAQAKALRDQAQLEDMKKRIAAETRKTEIEEASDKAFLIPEPPEVEWWDEGLLPEGQNSYENWQNPSRNKIEGDGSIVTLYIQHPVLLDPPQDKLKPAPKPMMLTPKEQAKMRRQRRMADMKEEQAKIRLGLVEPPAPKVKKSNMMRVLGEQAVKDPTAVEARVNREIAQRANDHLKANEDRKLTKEERHEKLKARQASDEAKGVHVAIFKIDSLSSGKHRYQIDVNAKQHSLTGIVVLNPDMNLVVVEGGSHSVEKYKKTLLNRVKWNENTLPLANDAGKKKPLALEKEWLQSMDQRGELKDLSENRCVLVWEGMEKAKAFKDWRSRVAETDGEARDILKRGKMENMWTLARTTG